MTADETIRTAVVIVHGMGEQRPMDTLDGFVKMALRPRDVNGEPKWDYYYSRPAEVTGSYEARRYISRQLGSFMGPDGAPTEPIQGQTEIYEYHWSYLMTGNRFADVMPKTLRLLLRRASNVPDALFGIWRVVWIVLLAILLAIPALFVAGYLLNTDVPAWIIGVIVSAVILIFWFGLFRLVARALVNKVTKSFVDVVRYLDTSPHSYAARRAIRGGLVDLLHALHDGRYSRVVVVAHSLGAYIAYDALTALWAQTHELHAGPIDDPIPLESLDTLEGAADRLIADPDAPGALDDFQDLQFALWQDLRRQGNPWRITDFVTAGTPMALADLLVTRPSLFSGFTKADRTYRTELFDSLVRRGALVRCPPRSETLPVESNEHHPVSYRWNRSGPREVLGSQSPFAVTRWTNLWFPVTRGELPATGSAVHCARCSVRASATSRYLAMCPNGSNAVRPTPSTLRTPTGATRATRHGTFARRWPCRPTQSSSVCWTHHLRTMPPLSSRSKRQRRRHGVVRFPRPRQAANATEPQPYRVRPAVACEAD